MVSFRFPAHRGAEAIQQLRWREGKSGAGVIRPDGTLRNINTLPRGCWEARGSEDNGDSGQRTDAEAGVVT